jgi:hypothetical protein
MVNPSPRQPATTIERLTLAALTNEHTTSLSALVERVARELYSAELARGAATLDIGLFGPQLFAGEVASALAAGNGVLWRFET